MKIFKNIKLVAAALLICAGFTACSEDEPVIPTTPTTPLRGEQGFYVINQGNMGVLDGTLDFFSTDSTRSEGIFKAVNNKSLGDTPQRAVLYGSKLYLPVFTENKVWVLDANTARVIAEVNTNQPEAVCGANGYVFVSNNDGYVTRVDTTSFTASAPLAVGPNPANMTTYNNKVYVSISDGYNSGNGYANGFKVAEIDAAQFNVTRNITVGMNPGDITSDNEGNIYVVCRGDYGATPSKVWKFNVSNGEAAAMCEGSLIAVNNQQRTSRTTGKQDVLYVLNVQTDYSNWSNISNVITSAVYNTATGEKVADNFLSAENLPANPIAIDVCPTDGNLYICSDATTGADAFTTPGYIKVYNASGAYIKTLTTGVHPFGVVFK